MNISNNSYLYNLTTREKNRTKLEKIKEEDNISNKNYINPYKRINHFQSPILDIYNNNELFPNFILNKKENKNYPENKINISEQKVKNYFYSNINPSNFLMNKNNNKEIETNNNNNQEIHQYNIFKKKSKYQRSNSLAYVKKRPNDLIKCQNKENNSMINIRFLRNSNKLKARCQSCSNIKKCYNPFNIDKEENEGSNNNSLIFPVSCPFMEAKNEIKEQTVNNFLNKSKNKTSNKNKNIFCNSILKSIKHNLLMNKIIFFKNIKIKRKTTLYEVSAQEYKFLEELKELGVTNIKELNSLLKDIYISIKGNNNI